MRGNSTLALFFSLCLSCASSGATATDEPVDEQGGGGSDVPGAGGSSQTGGTTHAGGSAGRSGSGGGGTTGSGGARADAAAESGAGGSATHGGPVLMGYILSLGDVGGTAAFDTIDFGAVDILSHAFATASADGASVIEASGSEFNAYRAAGLLTKARATNPNIKVLMSLGGSNHSGPLMDVALSATKLPVFAQAAADTMSTWGYDGIDIDVEFPGQMAPSGVVFDGKAFTAITKALYGTAKAKKSGAVVTFGVSPGYFIDQYEWAQLATCSDYAFYFCYTWNVPQNGPMTSTQKLTAMGGHVIEESCRGAIQYMIGSGYPASKIIVGHIFASSGNVQWNRASATVHADAAPDAASMEVLLGGAWWDTPNALKMKMAAVLDPAKSVLSAKATVAGVGFWEWGYEDPASPDLSRAIKTEAAKYGR
jgi:hypothetical protein